LTICGRANAGGYRPKSPPIPNQPFFLFFNLLNNINRLAYKYNLTHLNETNLRKLPKRITIAKKGEDFGHQKVLMVVLAILMAVILIL